MKNIRPLEKLGVKEMTISEVKNRYGGLLPVVLVTAIVIIVGRGVTASMVAIANRVVTGNLAK